VHAAAAVIGVEAPPMNDIVAVTIELNVVIVVASGMGGGGGVQDVKPERLGSAKTTVPPAYTDSKSPA
jgi:hypothetical protein